MRNFGPCCICSTVVLIYMLKCFSFKRPNWVGNSALGFETSPANRLTYTAGRCKRESAMFSLAESSVDVFYPYVSKKWRRFSVRLVHRGSRVFQKLEVYIVRFVAGLFARLACETSASLSGMIAEGFNDFCLQLHAIGQFFKGALGPLVKEYGFSRTLCLSRRLWGHHSRRWSQWPPFSSTRRKLSASLRLACVLVIEGQDSSNFASRYQHGQVVCHLAAHRKLFQTNVASRLTTNKRHARKFVLNRSNGGRF